jgi:hypothetical protein
MASQQDDPLIIGRAVFYWTVAGALAFAGSAYLLVG